MADAIEGGQTKVYMTVDWHRNGEQIDDPNAPEGGNGYCMDEYVLSPEIYEIESDGTEFPSLAAGQRWFAAHYDGDDDDGIGVMATFEGEGVDFLGLMGRLHEHAMVNLTESASDYDKGRVEGLDEACVILELGNEVNVETFAGPMNMSEIEYEDTGDHYHLGRMQGFMPAVDFMSNGIGYVKTVYAGLMVKRFAYSSA